MANQYKTITKIDTNSACQLAETFLRLSGLSHLNNNSSVKLQTITFTKPATFSVLRKYSMHMRLKVIPLTKTELYYVIQICDQK